MKDTFMHLTNYAINKYNTDFVQNDNDEGAGEGHKRSLTQVYDDIIWSEGCR